MNEVGNLAPRVYLEQLSPDWTVYVVVQVEGRSEARVTMVEAVVREVVRARVRSDGNIFEEVGGWI